MKHLISLFLITYSFVAVAQDSGVYHKKLHIEDNDTLRYRILYPQDYDAAKQYPLLVFLHGSGERGSDNEKQLQHGSSMFLEEGNREKHPAIVIFPQCPDGTMWSALRKHKTNNKRGYPGFPMPKKAPSPLGLVNGLVEEMMENNTIDESQMYVMGLSMGGFGTLEMLYHWGDKYAAAICICGGHNPKIAEKLFEIPIWFTHGGQDDIVSPFLSMDVYSALCKQPKNVDLRYTLFENENHNSWDSTFAQKDILEWLFQQKK